MGLSGAVLAFDEGVGREDVFGAELRADAVHEAASGSGRVAGPDNRSVGVAALGTVFPALLSVPESGAVTGLVTPCIVVVQVVAAVGGAVRSGVRRTRGRFVRMNGSGRHSFCPGLAGKEEHGYRENRRYPDPYFVFHVRLKFTF